MSAEWLTAIGTIGTFIVIAASAIAALVQLRHMQVRKGGAIDQPKQRRLVCVEDEGHEDEAAMEVHVREIRNPELIDLLRNEVAREVRVRRVIVLAIFEAAPLWRPGRGLPRA